MSDTKLRVRRGNVVFATYLRGALARRGMTRKRVGAELRVSETLVGRWTRGVELPTLERSERLAELLHDKRLHTMVVAARTRVCAYRPCSRSFMVAGSDPRIFCTRTCERHAMKNPKARRDARQEAIDAFCASCEPEGLCRTADCVLRPFSPLLFVPLHEVRGAA